MTDAELSLNNVLVVIPTLNEAAHIERCVQMLTQGGVFDIVVVDGGSSDGTQKLVLNMRREIPGLRLLHNPRRLQSAGLNLAVRKYAKPHHDILIRCDAHAFYPVDFIQNLVLTMTRTGAASVVIPMDSTGQTPFAKAAAWVVETILGNGGAAHRGGNRSGWIDHGHHAAFDLHWFRRIGGYDTRFSHNEDGEYDYRLWQAGGEIWLDSKIRIIYLMRPTFFALTRQYFLYGRGRARMLAKHNLRGRFRHLAPAYNLLTQLICIGLLPFSLWPMIIPLIYLSICTGAAIICACKLRSIAGIWAAPALWAMHYGWACGYLYEAMYPKRSTYKSISPDCV